MSTDGAWDVSGPNRPNPPDEKFPPRYSDFIFGGRFDPTEAE